MPDLRTQPPAIPPKSLQELWLMGFDEMGFVKPETVENELTIFAVYAANGARLAEFESRGAAEGSLRLSGLDIAPIH